MTEKRPIDFKASASVASQWHRLSTRPRGPHIIVPEMGKKMLGLLAGWPQPALPLWRRLEHRDIIPMPRWHEWKLTTGKAGMGSTSKWQGAEFDTWDPQGHLYNLKYHPLNDPALWRFCNMPSRKTILLSQQLITENGLVRVRLKAFNQWRRNMFRQQLQLVNKKRTIAELNKLCGMVKGFIDAIYEDKEVVLGKKDSACSVGTAADNRRPGSPPEKVSKSSPNSKRKCVSNLQLGPINQYEITDEMANSLFDSKEETDALLTELIRLHGLTQQIRNETEIFKRQTNKAKLTIRIKHKRDLLLAKIEAKDAEIVKRRHHMQLEMTAEKRRKAPQNDLKCRITFQNVMEKLDQRVFNTAKNHKAIRIEAWKIFFGRKHLCSEPIVPSGRVADERHRSPLIRTENLRDGDLHPQQPCRRIRKPGAAQSYQDVHVHKKALVHKKNPVHIQVNGNSLPEQTGHTDLQCRGYTDSDLQLDGHTDSVHQFRDSNVHEKDRVHRTLYSHPIADRSGQNDSHWHFHDNVDSHESITASSDVDVASSTAMSHHRHHSLVAVDEVASQSSGWDSLVEKLSTVVHNHNLYPSPVNVREVASQSSFEMILEENEEGSESRGNKTLRPLKSALSKPGGRLENRHMNVTFPPEVLDEPVVPTAKRSSEVLLDENVPATNILLAQQNPAGNSVGERESIPIDVPLRAAESITSMPIISESATSNVKNDDENAPEYDPYYVTGYDYHLKNLYLLDGRDKRLHSTDQKGHAFRYTTSDASMTSHTSHRDEDISTHELSRDPVERHEGNAHSFPINTETIIIPVDQIPALDWQKIPENEHNVNQTEVKMEIDQIIGFIPALQARSGPGSLTRENAAEIVEQLSDDAVEVIGHQPDIWAENKFENNRNGQ